jgi:hypothetical protein
MGANRPLRWHVDISASTEEPLLTKTLKRFLRQADPICQQVVSTQTLVIRIVIIGVAQKLLVKEKKRLRGAARKLYYSTERMQRRVSHWQPQ